MHAKISHIGVRSKLTRARLSAGHKTRAIHPVPLVGFDPHRRTFTVRFPQALVQAIWAVDLTSLQESLNHANKPSVIYTK